MRTSLGLAAASLLLIAGCAFPMVPAVVGNGTIKEESRPIADFHAIDVGSSLHATVTIGPKASVTLLGDENLLPLVRVEVREGRLVANLVDNVSIRPTRPLMLTIVAPTGLDRVAVGGAAKVDVTATEVPSFAVEADGAGVVTIVGIVSDSIDLQADGASRVKIEGKGKRLKLTGQGAVSLTASGLAVDSAEVSLNGASRSEVNVTGSVEGALNGASSLKVLGEPKTRAVKTNGAASVSY